MNTCKIEEITYITTDEPKDGGCKGCAGETDSVLCSKLLDELNCYASQIIWIKQEDYVKQSEEITFTPEQINYLSEVFGIDASEEVLKVSDGFIRKSGMVWWKHAFGPENVKVIEHLYNIKDYPEFYSIKKPKYKVVYE